MSKRRRTPGGAGRTKRLRKKREKWLKSKMTDTTTTILRRLGEDYAEVAGNQWQGFFCPILCEQGTETGLIDGHILPQGLKQAARTTIFQRVDVDNYFGHTLEPDLIDFLNSETFTKTEFFAKAKNVTITPEGGTPAKPFIASPKSTPPFPRIVLKDRIEGVIASPFVKTTWENMGGSSGVVRLEGDLAFSVPAVHGAIVKSAHLALFRLYGYRWVTGASGRWVANALASFVRDKARKEDAARYFSGFAGAFNFFWKETLSEDTLSGSLLLLHFEEGYFDPGHVFAISCLFNVNKRTLIVTLPYAMTDETLANSMTLYDSFRADRYMPHNVCVVRVTGRNTMDMQPIKLQYIEPAEAERPSGSNIEG